MSEKKKVRRRTRRSHTRRELVGASVIEAGPVPHGLSDGECHHWLAYQAAELYKETAIQ